MTEEQYVQKQSGVTTIDGADYPVWKAATSGFMNFDLNPEALYGFGWQYGGGGEIVAYANTWGGSYRIDNRLYDKIDDNDYRKDNFHKDIPEDFPTIYYAGSSSFIDGGQSNVPTYWTSKFTNNVGLGGGVGNSNEALRNRIDYAFVRLSEIYLLKAEAQARGGDKSGARSTLNTLLAARTAAGKTPLTCDNYESMKGMDELQMVQFQSRIELWGEGGLEWFNNRRWNIPVNRSGSTVHWNPAMTYPVSQMTMKVPSEEISSNPNFGPQNP